MKTKLRLFLSRNLAIVAFHLVFVFLFRGLPAVGSPLFVLASMIAGVYLWAKNDLRFITFMLWLIFLTPLYRRLADFGLGRQDLSFVMLMPTLLSCLPVLRYLTRKHPRRVTLALWGLLGSLLYGLMISVVRHNLVAGLYEFMEYLGPLSMFMFIFTKDCTRSELKQVLLTNLVLFLIVCGGYGIYQFAAGTPWDMAYVREAKLWARDKMEAGDLRIFGTMNGQPYSVALALSIAFIVLEARMKDLWQAVALPIGIFALMLTQLRASWVMLLVALAYAYSRISLKLMLSVSAISLVSLVFVFSNLLTTDATKKISERFSTFTSSPQQDLSYLQRLEQIDDCIETVKNNPMGQGFGNKHSSVAFSHQDMGILAKTSNLGPVAALIFFVSLFSLIRTAWIRSPGETALRGMLVALLVGELFNETFAGPVGLFFFLILACMAKREDAGRSPA